MKILHITERPRFSGAEILIKDLSLSHINKHTVAITSINPIEDDFYEIMQLLQQEDVQLIIPDNPLSKLKRLSYLFKVFKDFQPDIIVGHSAIVSVYMRIVGVLFPKIKKVVVLHAAAADYESGDRLQKVEYFLQYFTDYVVGVSEWSQNTYQKRYKHVPCKTIYNGVDFEKFGKKYQEYRAEIRDSVFKAGENTFTILQVGRINEVKNQLLTLEAVLLLPKNIIDNVLLVFAGIIEDEEYYMKLKEVIESNHLNNNVNFLGARSDVNKLLYASDLYVMPSARENFSIAILEALFTGIPTLHSNISQFDYLEQYNFKHVYKVDLSDINTISETIANCIKNKAPFVHRDIDDFSFKKCSEQYLELFEEITK